MKRLISIFFHPLSILLILIVGLYYQFFLFGKIPFPADTLVGAYYPWLDYGWGFPTGVPVKNPPISDVFSQLYLWRMMSIDFMKQGFWPLWNPYSALGSPLLANYQSAPFLPFNLILLLPKYFNWGFYLFVQTAIAVVGMYFLTGKFVKSHLARILGGIVFALSGLMTTYTEFAMAGWAASMLPWIFFFGYSYLEAKSKNRYGIFFALSFTTLFLSGHAQLTVYSSCLFVLFLFYQYFIQKGSLKKLLLLFGFFLLAAGIAALQLLPTFDHIKLSIRNVEEYSWTFNYGLNSWYEIIRLVSADFFGNPTTYNHWDNISYHEHSTFLGTLTILLILPLIKYKFNDKRVKFWISVLLGSIFLAFKHPLTEWFYSQPIPFLTNSSASRIFFLLSLAAGLLVAVSLNEFIKEKKFRNLVFKYSLAIFSVFLLLEIMMVIYSQRLAEGQMIQNLKVTIKNFMLPIGILIIFLLLRPLYNRKIKLVALIIVAIIFIDLGRYFLKYNPFMDSNLMYPKTPVIDFLQQQKGLFRIARFDSEVLPPNTWTAYNLYSAEGYDPLMLQNYNHLFNKVNKKSFDVGVSRYRELEADYDLRYLDALNVKYFLAIKKDEKGEIPGKYLEKKLLDKSNFKIIFEDKSVAVLENLNVLPRAYFTRQVQSVASRSELVKVLDDPQFDPRNQAILIDGVTSDYPTDGEITVISNKPNLVSISTNTIGERFLVLSEAYEKGWQLTRNGQKHKLYEVNGALRGIIVPEGQNIFELRYWPEAFDLGLKLTIFSFCLLILISGYTLLKKKW